MWRATFISGKDGLAEAGSGITPVIRGVGGCWGQGVNDCNYSVEPSPGKEGALVEPFYVQYEKRMEYLRRILVQKQRYRLRMYAYSTLQFNPIKANKFLDRKKNLFTERDAQICSCVKAKTSSKMEA